MRDIWAFLLQTLTVSGAAVLLLAVKAMFRDKLSPRWQFAVWGVLGMVLLIPAGFGGRYALLNWPLAVETVKSLLSEKYTLTRVTAPIPVPAVYAPETVWDWLFLIYFAGVILLTLHYLVSYVRLRWALGQGKQVDDPRISAVAERYSLPCCPAVEVEGLSSAFICGVFSPVLVLPAGVETDEKVLLHELLHLKHRDALWGLVICFFRCVHWCNPLLWYCADQAGNDLESLCDQRVLEHLEGEDRREYGRILLSMANKKYARAPGTSSMANGGKNIRRRIEAIARFKRYPAGMALVSVCAAVILAAPLLFGTQAQGVYNEEGRMLTDRTDVVLSLASARTTPCTTVAGALDTYGKALLASSGTYRAMCAPMAMQGELAAGMLEREEGNLSPTWEANLPGIPDDSQRQSDGYYIYNLEFEGNDVYTALLVFPLKATQEQREENQMALAVQNVRAEKEDDRWVVVPLDELTYLECMEESLRWGARDLPTYTYSATAENFKVDIHHQKTFVVDNTITVETSMSWFLGPDTRFDSVPKPNAEFDTVYWSHWNTCTYTGSEENKDSIRFLGLSSAPVAEGEERPNLGAPLFADGSSSGSSGVTKSSRRLESGWGPEVSMGGGGSSGAYKGEEETLPAYYASSLHINGEKAAELSLLPEEGVAVW